MRVLLTGSTGGLGRSLLPKLRQHYGENVYWTSRSGEPNTNYIAADLTVASDVHSLIEKSCPDLIFHCSGSFKNDLKPDLDVNAFSCRLILESVAALGLKSRIVVFGSAAEYGVVSQEMNPVSEDRPLSPISVYGFTKSVQTHLAQFYARTQGTDVVIARVFNVLGKGFSQKLFVGRAEEQVRRYLAGEIDKLEFGSLQSQRDYISMDALFDQLLAIAKYGQKGEVYNVGSGRPIAMRKLLEDLVSAAGIPISAIDEMPSKFSSRQGTDIPIIYADMGKTSRLLKRLNDV